MSACIYHWEPSENCIVCLRDELASALADAERYRWAEPILTQSDEKIADARTLRLGLALSKGLTGNAAVDAARSGE